ncbi:MAG: 4-(cytidine 5'-diphospho)-2-C-methyl-D-erythritol kinase [Alphaproteobacteria bacterium]|nr:4-(cytidine 5'-diphospho)-2-C-methyl-D-erythritol kinase [Alphaproteobacteria bacterium]MCY4317740.1 4-(cytidine 5'-diphospho)-2-C-methyl-D-erythritol kinase [Alphaproteobacteria bacterium]
MLRERAPAKVNLYLHVVGRRADGLHLLESSVAFAEAGDTLYAEPADDLSLEVVGPFAGALADEADNLVLRAARALAPGRGARLVLKKTLPVAAGIGGGSADAAATLRLLSRLWGVKVDLEALAAALGADVPVCLAGRTTGVAGIGERLTPLSNRLAPPLLLVNPGMVLATPAVFGARRGPFRESRPWPQTTADLVGCANDLTDAAISLVPEIAEVLDALGRLEGALFARMSGSGATCFAAFADRTARARAREALRARHPDWWIA